MTLMARAPDPYTPSLDLARILDELDIGLLVGPPGLRTLHALNAAARGAQRLLEHRQLPDPLRAALQEALETAGDGRFTRALKIESPAGVAVYARAKRLAGAEPLILVTLTADTRRDRDLADELHDQFGLSARETQVVLMIRAGLRNGEIARRLGVRVATVKAYASRIYSAVGVRSRTELVAVIQDRILERMEPTAVPRPRPSRRG